MRRFRLRLTLFTLFLVLLGLSAFPPTRTLLAQGYSAAGTVLTKVTTLTAASLTTARYIYSQVVISPTAGTATIPASGSIAGVRGEVSIPTMKTFQDGFLFGTQGKGIITGTLNQTSAGRVAGVLGQIDTTSGTLTSGQVSAVWADLQGNSANAETYPLRVSNSASVSPPALGFFVGHATAALSFSDLGNGSSGDFVVNAAGTSAGECAQTGGVVFTKTLKIVADGTDYWIGLCTAP